MTGDAMHLSARERWAVKRAVAQAEDATGLQLCVYVGPAEGDSRARAEELFVAAGLDARPAVLVLVAPAEHRVEVVTAPSVRSRLDDATCAAAVEQMTARFAAGDLGGGLVAGVRFLADAAGRGTADPGATELPDLLDG